MATSLPNELWLHILTFCDCEEVWMLVRPVHQQLKECVEQHVYSTILPQMEVTLPVALPAYEIRQRVEGKCIFTHHAGPNTIPAAIQSMPDVVAFQQSQEPYALPSDFLSRWKSMQQSGRLHGLNWDVTLGDKSHRMPLRQPSVTMQRPSEDSQVVLMFEWTSTMTAYYCAKR
jgi:hypothetical protein